ncbi:hypothetical protein QFZ67_005321 [Streptomyces sp. V1I1]|nr:hypothetical protein [Streptomyces sp. V1I1]
MASKVTAPQAAARRTLGSGRHTTTNASVSAPPRRAVPRSVMPNRGARPRRSASRAVPGGPISRTSTTVRLLPDTASRCVRSVASKATCSSGVIREVSPTTSPGSRARASGASPSVASRSPARSPPAVRWRAVGGPVIRGGPSPSGLSTAANLSSSCRGGASRPVSRSRVEGNSRSQGALDADDSPEGTITRTDVRVSVTAPPGAVTRVTSASSMMDPRAVPSPRTRGRVARGSAVTCNSTVTYAYWPARSGSGPRRRSALCSPAEAAPAAAHSSIAARAVALS